LSIVFVRKDSYSTTKKDANPGLPEVDDAKTRQEGLKGH